MLWDGNRQAQEYTDTHVFTTVYEQNSFEPVARLVSNGNEFKIFYYHNDHLGTPNELTDEDGNVVWLADYDAWGNVSKACDAFKYQKQVIGNVEVEALELQPIRFQGQLFDSESGLHYNRFRYYDADCGIFISRDPIGLIGGMNVFAYAPNPIGWIDPFGLAKANGTFLKPFKYKEEVASAPSFNQARRMAQKKANMVGKTTLPFKQELGPSKGRITGSRTLDGNSLWRVDLDPGDRSKGFHINWSRKEKDKCGCWHIYRGLVRIDNGMTPEETENYYLQSIEHFPKP